MGVTPKLKIANEFFLTNIIAEKILKCKRDNIFLVGSKRGLSSGMRRKFIYTDEGNNIIDGCLVVFDGSWNDNYNAILPRDGKDIVTIKIDIAYI